MGEVDFIDSLVDILFKNSYGALATCSNQNVPWVTPLIYALDENLIFYWASAHQARHSVNLVQNPRCAISIYDSTQPQNNARGFYAEGHASVVQDSGLARAVRVLYGWRYPDPLEFAKHCRAPEEFMGPSVRRIYHLILATTYGLDPAGDPQGRPIDFRREAKVTDAFRQRFSVTYQHLLT